MMPSPTLVQQKTCTTQSKTINMPTISVTEASLQKSAVQFRKQLLLLAILGLDKILPYFTLRTGIRYKEVVGTLDGPFELRPYTGQKNASSDLKITGREVETYLGSCVKEFDPNELVQTIYGSGITSGKGLEGVDINKQVNALMMKRLSESIAKSLFKAKRNSTGTKTVDLFNGIDTITDAEIAENNISIANKNLFELTTAIDATNAVDILKEIYRNASDELQEEKVNLYVPRFVYNAYCDDYKQTTGNIAYNKEFNQTFVEGSNDLCTIVPLTAKKESPYIHLTPKSNMLIGCYQMGDFEKIEVRRGDNPFLMQFVTTMFLGTQMESIDPTRLLVAKQYVAPSNP